MTRVKPPVLIAILTGLVILAVVANLSIGAYQISIAEVISTLTASENVNPITS